MDDAALALLLINISCLRPPIRTPGENSLAYTLGPYFALPRALRCRKNNTKFYCAFHFYPMEFQALAVASPGSCMSDRALSNFSALVLVESVEDIQNIKYLVGQSESDVFSPHYYCIHRMPQHLPFSYGLCY